MEAAAFSLTRPRLLIGDALACQCKNHPVEFVARESQDEKGFFASLKNSEPSEDRYDERLSAAIQ
jgi:hypothetical protein